MPRLANGKIPPLLSQTGAFSDTRHLIPSEGLIPYDLVVAFWSDGAGKSRWAAVPDEKIKFSPTGEWVFPQGTVFVKTFELSTDAADPGVKRRLETRLLVRDSAGGVYGAVYKWRPDNSDADFNKNRHRRGAQANVVFPEPAGLSGMSQRQNQRCARCESPPDEPRIHLPIRGNRQ